MTPHRALRDYQGDCVTYLRESWVAGVNRPPAVLATGLGKTEIFTDPSLLDPFLDGTWDRRGAKRVLIIAHTDELIEQAARKARRNNPGRRVGIVKAQTNQTTAEIIVSSRQTLAGERRRNQIRNVGLIIIDEAHHALRTNTYGKILEHFGAFDSVQQCICDDIRYARQCHCGGGGQPVMVAGFTATLARGDKGKLSTVWQAPPGGIFKRDILFGIRRGYLLDVRGKRVVVPDLDMGNVKQSRGDYQDSALAEELERTFAPEVVAQAYVEHASHRKGIAFWPLVDTAYHGAKAFNEAGIRSEVIHGELPKVERRALLARLHSGETQVVHGVGVLTEGFDEPTCDVVVVARPTRSAPLYQQMVGRVLRPDLTLPAEAREKALILDVVGAGAAHDLRSLIDLSPERKREEGYDDDASLLEIDAEWQEWQEEQQASGGQGVDFAEDYAGETEIKEFDPLGRDKLWSRTPGGAWFMSAGGVGYVFLVESLAGEPSHYDVVLCSKLSYRRDGVDPWARATDYADLPLEEALGWAEELAIETGGHGTKSLTGKKSAWRRAEPTEAQKNYATRLGIDPTGLSKGELSERIDNVNAARRIDPLVKAVRAAAQ